MCRSAFRSRATLLIARAHGAPSAHADLAHRALGVGVAVRAISKALAADLVALTYAAVAVVPEIATGVRRAFPRSSTQIAALLAYGTRRRVGIALVAESTVAGEPLRAIPT